MSNSTNPFDTDPAEVYTDDDGAYTCTLNKVNDTLNSKHKKIVYFLLCR